MSVGVSLGDVRQRMASAAQRVGRNVEDVELVVIGKGQPVAVLQQAFDAGQRIFGENRGQELASKVGRLPGEVRWHFVGPLQTNKVRLVRPRVELLQSFDRDRLIKPWLRGEGKAPPALLQVNIGMEAQKHGVPPDLVLETFDRWESAGIRLNGLMAIPPLGRTPRGQPTLFRPDEEDRGPVVRPAGPRPGSQHGNDRRLRGAIEEGSTMVRVGRAIFGRRPTVGWT